MTLFLRALRDLRGFVRLALDSAARIYHKRMNVTNCFRFNERNYIIRNDPILQQQIDFDSALPNDELFN
jgi:hypothetical protein